MSHEPFDLAAANAKLADVKALLAGHTDRSEESRILGILRGARAGELDHLLSSLPLDALISSVDDRLIGPDHRTALFQLLCHERLADLSIRTRAALVSTLQRGRTSAQDERAIAWIFLGTRGKELTALKNAVDGSGDYHDIEQLIHHDIDDAGIREQILDHIRVEATPRTDLKILSDIDDTLYRNWKDTRYPKSKEPRPYPGVLAFYRELDLAFSADGEPRDLTFLTARPGDRVGIGEGITRKHLAAFGLSYAKVLTGDFGHLLTHELMAEKKYMGFIEYRKVFPEYSFVFCGDSGQGDAIAGGLMMEHPGGSVRGVFIHDVVGTDEQRRASWREKGVYFNDTYVGAALDAHELGLLHAEAVRNIALSALAELEAIHFDDHGMRKDRFHEFRRDADRVNAILPADRHI